MTRRAVVPSFRRAVLLLLLAAPPLTAQEISRGFAIDDNAAIRIFNLGGTITVRGWDRDSIAVTTGAWARTRASGRAVGLHHSRYSAVGSA